ncbi:hypothetical protein T484DRAFT_1900714 [Baffinella frigidus]|nr:hypothetical protein T484DRAFT_1900714 [Cryptophyta sp. CCMP2293]
MRPCAGVAIFLQLLLSSALLTGGEIDDDLQPSRLSRGLLILAPADGQRWPHGDPVPLTIQVVNASSLPPDAVVEAAVDGASVFGWGRDQVLASDGILALVLDRLVPGEHHVSARALLAAAPCDDPSAPHAAPQDSGWGAASAHATFQVLPEPDDLEHAPHLQGAPRAGVVAAAGNARARQERDKGDAGGAVGGRGGGRGGAGGGGARAEVRIVRPRVNEVLAADEDGAATLQIQKF